MPPWLTFATLLFSAPAQAQTWWDPAWDSRATLSFDNSAQTDSLSDFPVLVVLDDATNFDHAAASAGGDDLRFVDADGTTELAYEIERWNVGGVSHIWVNVPVIDGSSSTDRIYLYWGNPSAPAGEDGPATWRSSYIGVYHLTGDEDDSSTPTHHGSASGTSSAAGMIADATDFDGNGDQIELPNESSFDFQDAVTVSFWVQVDAFIHLDWDAFVTKGDQTWRIHRCGGSNTVAFSHDWSSGDTGVNGNTCGSIPVDDGAWHYVVGTYDASMGTKSIYIDGALDVQVSESRSFDTNNDDVWIGNNQDHTGRSLDGRMDEVRIEDVGHTADWIAADYLSVTNAFVTICSPWQGDTDGDGNCDSDDLCPGQDDFLDTDGDTVVDCLDPCPLDDPDDTDGDGLCDSFDPCPQDNPNDTDGDGVCDSDDVCPGQPDDDTDGDGVLDCLDDCPLDNPDDTDGDGVCDTDDQCPGVDDTEDSDGDGLGDCVDACPQDNPNDIDGDGVCDSDDVCLGYDDGLDTDGDGIPNGCDACALGDSDADGVPDDCDLCPGEDDGLDADGDGAPDGCDPCPTQAGQLDQDFDGWFDCEDCDDLDAAIHPGATDIPDNGIDEDCDGADATTGTTDTGTPVDPPDDSSRSWDPGADPDAIGDGPVGCGCDNGGAPMPLSAIALLLVAVSRRRSSRTCPG